MMIRTTLTCLLAVLSCALYAQYPDIVWEYPLTAPAFGSASAADLDGDGKLEIVFTTYTNDGRAHCLNAEDGSVHWVFDIGGCGDVAPLIADVNDDGLLEVVINGSCNPTIFCINGQDGSEIWSKPSGGGDSPPTMADMDNDGDPEILFGNFNGEVRILHGEDGSMAQTIQANPNGNAVQTEPTTVDVNGDGNLDVIAANFFNENGLFVWAFNYSDGSLIWENEQTNPDADFHAYHSGALADVDGDDKLEYVIGSGAGYVHAINVEDGSTLWKEEYIASNMGAVTIADLDLDGELEVIFNNNDYITLDERIRILSGPDGTQEWTYPVTFTSFRGMSVSDIDGNGSLDLISGHFMGRVRAIEPYTGQLWELNTLDYIDDGDQLPYYEVDSQPLVADFDQNGTADVFVVGGYGTYYPDEQNVGKAFLIEAGDGGCPEWLMFRHDVRRTGFLSPEEVEESCGIVSVQNLNTSDFHWELYPNPGEEITLELTLDVASEVDLKCYDQQGRLIAEEKLGEQSPGVHLLRPRMEMATGHYLMQIQLNEEISKSKRYVRR